MNKQASFDSYSTKRVSYILTTKNRAKFLDAALSNYSQLVKANDELIIIDGGSTDETDKVIKKYAHLVNVYLSESDISASHAFNKGILLAKGKYIKNINDDDTIYSEAIEKAIAVLEKNPAVDVLVCGGTKQHGCFFSVFYVPEGADYGKEISDVIKHGACGVGLLIRHKSLALSGLIPTGLASDAAFLIKCIDAGLNVKFCRINLFNHPIYTHSTVVAKAREHEKDLNTIISRYLPKKTYLKYKLYRAWVVWPRYTEKVYKIFPILKPVFWPARILLRRVNRRRIKEREGSKSKDINSLISNKKYKWDSGFS